MECRPGCGACCIAPSISSAIPGMTEGKPSGVRCIQLTDANLCLQYGLPDRPEVCTKLSPSLEMCGLSTDQAFDYLTRLELITNSD